MDRPITLLLIAATLAGCGSGTAGPEPATPQQRTAWLEPHNQVRAGTFPGVTVSPAPSPALPALTWSTAAEGVAQKWADGCVWGHNPDRNPDGVARGENIAASSPSHWDEAGVVGAWASEWVGYDHDANTCTPPPPPAAQACGHYTQLVWRSTLRVGCGYRRCTTGSPFPGFTTWDFFVCDYEPPGNNGQRPY